jgi:pimeloyl-ACP methyl ester carboxylesterase
MCRAKTTGFVVANGAHLYYEKQGDGPTLLLIAGSTGDTGNFSRTADLLAGDFTVMTYDRRGNSRGPRPRGWTATSVGEQADDAAELIRALDLAPAAVFGASTGGLIALDLMIRFPVLVRAGVLQEPGLFAVLPDPMVALTPRRSVVEAALPVAGRRGAVAALLRYLNDDGRPGGNPTGHPRAHARQRRHHLVDREPQPRQMAPDDRGAREHRGAGRSDRG